MKLVALKVGESGGCGGVAQTEKCIVVQVQLTFPVATIRIADCNLVAIIVKLCTTGNLQVSPHYYASTTGIYAVVGHKYGVHIARPEWRHLP